MGFRNPVTSAVDPDARASAAAAMAAANSAQTAANSAQTAANNATALASAITSTQITPGAITTPALAANAVTGAKISANAIDGKTITGATIQTAATGPRIVFASGDQDTQLFYSGTTGEVGPGELTVGVIADTRGAGTSPAADAPRLYLTPPAIGNNHIGDVSLELRGPTRDGATKGYAQVVGDFIALGNVYMQGTVSYPGAGWTTITPASPLNPGATGSAFTVRGGRCDLVYDVAYTGAMTKGFVVHTLPAGARPTRDCFIDGYTYTGAQFGLYVHASSGQVTIDTGYASSVSGFVATGTFPVG
jgi:hypothetical protein